MKKNDITLLVVDDDSLVRESLVELFSDDYQVLAAASGADAIETVRKQPELAVIIMDIKMAGMDGIAAMREIRSIAPDIPTILHTGYPGDFDEDEIDRLEQPFDYVQKGDAISRLIRSVRNAVEKYEYRRGLASLADHAASRFRLIGRSKAMQTVYELIIKMAGSDNKVMILGENGTGKELVARAIHDTGARRERRLAILNCNHKSFDLVESELFGHEQGAFTGATRDRDGLFGVADGGTVFLDEIGDLDITTQAKLLRVLSTGEYSRIGSEEVRRVDVRILCATNRNLEQLVASGAFREDLYYRLCGVVIKLPPLRERPEDIPLLVEHFRDKYTIARGLPLKLIAPDAIEPLLDQPWPGNVRHLEEAVRALITLSDSDVIMREDVLAYLKVEDTEPVPTSGTLSEQVRAFERRLIIATLTACSGVISRAADRLGVDRANLSRKIRQLGIDPDAFH